MQNTAGIVSSYEYRQNFDYALWEELGPSLYVNVPGFAEKLFGVVLDPQPIAKTVFQKCQTGNGQLFDEKSGWQGWPHDANETRVLTWFQTLVKKLLNLAKEDYELPQPQMRILSKLCKPVPGSVSRQKLDVGFVKTTPRQAGYDWSQILIPGELKCNQNEDRHENTWLDLARYAREIFNAKSTRRFVQGFTLCGPLMRLWEFDRLGGIASSAFNINKDGLELSRQFWVTYG